MRVRCPECGGETRFEGNPDRPFCSERCRLIDLGKWASGTYRLPVVENDASAGEEPPRDEPEPR
jgi:endogenous inhibitor of DNA gyrase (YacG/DUF329 family)